VTRRSVPVVPAPSGPLADYRLHAGRSSPGSLAPVASRHPDHSAAPFTAPPRVGHGRPVSPRRWPRSASQAPAGGPIPPAPASAPSSSTPARCADSSTSAPGGALQDGPNSPPGPRAAHAAAAMPASSAVSPGSPCPKPPIPGRSGPDSGSPESPRLGPVSPGPPGPGAPGRGSASLGAASATAYRP